MATAAFNPLQLIAFTNPNNQGVNALQIQRQQALAQQLMDQGSQMQEPNMLANPGGFVVPISPLQGLSKALEKSLGGYMQGQADRKQAALYQALANPNKSVTDALSTGSPLPGQVGPTQQNLPLAQALMQTQGQSTPTAMSDPQFMRDMMVVGPEDAYKGYIARQDAILKNQLDTQKAEQTNTYTDAQGVTHRLNTLPNTAANLSTRPPMPASAPSSAPTPPDNGPPAKPVVLSSDKADAPMAADGKPLLPTVKTVPPADPSGTPRFKTDNTKTGVEQTIQDQKDAAEGNKAFAAMSQSLSQEKARLDNLIQIYKDVQSGTLTAQNPEFFNKMAALGFSDDPKSLHDLAGIQNATQNHILQVIQQIKDTNANAGGGAPTRVFGSEIGKLLDEGESAKNQPEALWNVIGQAKGLVDHHLDMINGWNAVGGLGNRLAGGYTMRPDDYATQFSLHHNISDYRDNALKEMGPFKGMAGNTGSAAPPVTKTINGVTYTKINGVWHE